MAIVSRNLSASRLLDQDESVEDDPMSSMGNLMDIMLVFACALMIALITHYNVDLTKSDPIINESETIEGDLTSGAFTDENEDDYYEELGTAFRDLETGEIYIVEPN